MLFSLETCCTHLLQLLKVAHGIQVSIYGKLVNCGIDWRGSSLIKAIKRLCQSRMVFLNMENRSHQNGRLWNEKTILVLYILQWRSPQTAEMVLETWDALIPPLNSNKRICGEDCYFLLNASFSLANHWHNFYTFTSSRIIQFSNSMTLKQLISKANLEWKPTNLCINSIFK